jgi:hypothetical protein
MSLTVTRARIKEKCGVADTTYDTPIDNIISDYVAAIEYSVEDQYIADVSNPGLQATLNLGALEVCCGEFYAQRFREPGAADVLDVDGIVLKPNFDGSARDPSGLVLAGWSRLAPYLKSGVQALPIAGVLSAFKEEA